MSRWYKIRTLLQTFKEWQQVSSIGFPLWELIDKTSEILRWGGIFFPSLLHEFLARTSYNKRQLKRKKTEV
jgi:hypothetical protein